MAATETMEELETLILEAEALGIPNPTMYKLLPKDKRIDALKKDIDRAKKQSASADE